MDFVNVFPLTVTEMYDDYWILFTFILIKYVIFSILTASAFALHYINPSQRIL